MKIWKSILTGIFWLVILALLLAPVGLIFQISEAEMQEYATPQAPVLRETAIGAVVQAVRQDVEEFVTVSGTFTSTAYGYMELDYQKVQNVRWIVGIGDEVQEGQVIGTGKQGDILSTVTGIVNEMHIYSPEDCYIRFRLFTPVELSCQVDARTLSALKNSDELTTKDGKAVTLTFASQQKYGDGSTSVRLSIDGGSYTYGEYLDGLMLLTGRVYKKTMTLPESCIYQKSQDPGSPWYVRRVTETGLFIEELRVEIGYSNGTMVCVTGVQEGDYFDSGYRAVAGG